MQDVLDGLIEKGWLIWNPKLLKIHPIIRIVCREELRPTDENCGVFLNRLAECYDSNHFDKDSFFQLAELFSGAADDLKDMHGEWAFHAGRLWYELGEMKKSLAYNQKMVTRREQNYPESEELVTAYNNMGSTYYALGNYNSALEYLKKAKLLGEKFLPPENPGFAAIYSNIGLVYSRLGNHKLALDYVLKSVRICENTNPTNNRNLAVSYDIVGRIYGDLGNSELELEYTMKAMSICEKFLSPEHPDFAAFYNNAGSAYINMGDYERALEYALKALQIGEKVLPPDHPHIVIQCNNIALTYAKMNNYVAASEYADKALEKAERSMQGHPDLPDYRWRAEAMKR